MCSAGPSGKIHEELFSLFDRYFPTFLSRPLILVLIFRRRKIKTRRSVRRRSAAPCSTPPGFTALWTPGPWSVCSLLSSTACGAWTNRAASCLARCPVWLPIWGEQTRLMCVWNVMTRCFFLYREALKRPTKHSEKLFQCSKKQTVKQCSAITSLFSWVFHCSHATWQRKSTSKLSCFDVSQLKEMFKKKKKNQKLLPPVVLLHWIDNSYMPLPEFDIHK